jgi:hypothetical protein
MAGARHGVCELRRNDIAGERHGNGMGAAWHVAVAKTKFCFSYVNRTSIIRYLTSSKDTV